MEPLAIVAFTGGMIGQIGILLLWCRPIYNCVQRFVDCLRNPQPLPPQEEINEKIFNVLKDRFYS